MPKQTKGIPPDYTKYQVDLAKRLGARIKQRRQELGLTQEELRARLDLSSVHITRSQFSRIEVGERLPDAAELLALSTVLGTSLDWLLLSELST